MCLNGAVPPPETKVTLQVLWQSQDAIRVTPFKEGSVLESTVKTSRVCPFHSGLVADRAREILGLLARANAGGRNLLAPLVRAGQAIYVDLLPAFLKDKLPAAAGSNLVLHLDHPLLGIPWELLHDGEQFLGRRFRIGRLVSVEHDTGTALQRAMRAPLSVLVVADPAGDLPAARREAEELSALLGESPLFGPVTVLCGDVSLRTFRDELPRHDVLHYAGHADAGGGTAAGASAGGFSAGAAPAGAARLRLKDGPCSTELLRQLRGRVDFPGLVFLNACGSSDESRRLSAGDGPGSGVPGLAAELLLCGARHVVGTLWEVRDEVARLAAGRFYRELGRGGTIGAALGGAREELTAGHGEDSLLWASRVLYGDPTWRLAAPPNAEFEDFGVLDGLAARYRQELLAADAGGRLVAAAMLLRLGDRSVIPALGRDLDELLRWLAPDAAQRERRRAALVVQALATAAGLQPSGPPDDLPDPAAVRALYARLAAG